MTNKKQQIKNVARDARIGEVVIEQPRVMSVTLEVAGTADLLQNKFSQKAVEQILRKHMGLSVQREVKRPREVIEDATIKNVDGRVCIPPVAFKSAMLSASTALKGLKKTQLRTALFIEGGSLPITYQEMVSTMAMVRTSGMSRGPDVRFRPSFVGWHSRMIIQFGEQISIQTVVDLLNRAGTVGVGEWRPEKNGMHGTFRVSRHISEKKEIDEIRAECSSQLVPLRIPEWALDMEITPETLRDLFVEEKIEPYDAEAFEPKNTKKKNNHGARI